MNRQNWLLALLLSALAAFVIVGCTGDVRKSPDERSDFVEYRANGATSGVIPTERTYVAGGHPHWVKENSGNLQRSGYAFAGWNTEPDGTGKDYAPGATIMMGDQVGNTDVILYAKWE